MLESGSESKHSELSNTAIHWLHKTGCSVFANEVPTKNGISDALGVKTNQRRYGGRDTVYYIEAKASRADLICSKQRYVYAKSVGEYINYCLEHERLFSRKNGEAETCNYCVKSRLENDNGIDFYYLIVANGVEVEAGLYPLWGVIDESGKVIRKAKRIKRTNYYHADDLVVEIAHKLAYKVFGKLYLQ